MIEIDIQMPEGHQEGQVGDLFTDGEGDLYVKTEDYYAKIGPDTWPPTYPLRDSMLTPLPPGTIVILTIK